MISREIKNVYMMGIGGIAMGTLAAMLKEKGLRVSGSDQNLYPPMSTALEALQIPIHLGYDASNPSKGSPDLFVIGNVIRRDNPEARFVIENDLPRLSMPQAIAKFFLPERKSIVVAGTHGKSTTSSLLSWVLEQAGMDPSAFIGAFLKDWEKSYRLGEGPYMVIEGDEYDTAFFDKGPKFLHYQPHIGIITSVEFDHADIFRNFDAVFDAFKRFVEIVPPEGKLIVNADDPQCIRAAEGCRGQTATYGWSEKADWRILTVEHPPGEVRFVYHDPLTGRNETMRSFLPGRHNASNTLAVIAAASLAGLSADKIREAVETFRGVKRRQDIVGDAGGVLIMDDFAHHPTAVRETIDALSLFYPDRRLIVAFEPRTNSSRRSVFQEDYATAFDRAACVCIKEPPGMDAIPQAERMDSRKLVADIRIRDKEAHYFKDADSLLHFLRCYASRGDLVVCMSNGSFDALPRRLMESLNGKNAPERVGS